MPIEGGDARLGLFDYAEENIDVSMAGAAENDRIQAFVEVPTGTLAGREADLNAALHPVPNLLDEGVR